jgi:hypothetical protein
MNPELSTPWGKQPAPDVPRPMTGFVSTLTERQHAAARPSPTAANDNRRPIIIGITGRRNVGKSTMARLLESEFGFMKVHAFEGGKESAVALFAYMTGDWSIANRMVYGDLKDKPSDLLPGGVAPRHYLEEYGKFMGVTMGVEWTLAMEVARARRLCPSAPIVVESLVYEVDWFRANGGYIVRLERPDHDGPAVGSDAFQAAIVADETIEARTVAELGGKVLRLMDRQLARWG